jgi:hypothetical protein
MTFKDRRDCAPVQWEKRLYIGEKAFFWRKKGLWLTLRVKGEGNPAHFFVFHGGEGEKGWERGCSENPKFLRCR